jgi:hypothetical protein
MEILLNEKVVYLYYELDQTPQEIKNNLIDNYYLDITINDIELIISDF